MYQPIYNESFNTFITMKKYLIKYKGKYCNLADLEGFDCYQCNHLEFCKDYDIQFFEVLNQVRKYNT